MSFWIGVRLDPEIGRHQGRDPRRPIDPGIALLTRKPEHQCGRACTIDQLAFALLQS